MSVTESKAKTGRKSSRKAAKTQETALSALLAQTEEVSVPLASLIKSPLNVRTVPYLWSPSVNWRTPLKETEATEYRDNQAEAA